MTTCSIALIPDGYEPRDSVNSLTAFSLNSGVYLVPFAMVPSSPIELRAMRNKNQFISDFRPILVMVGLGLGKAGVNPTGIRQKWAKSVRFWGCGILGMEGGLY